MTFISSAYCIFPASHSVGKRLRKGELLAEATGVGLAPGIEIGWAGPAPAFHGTLFQARHGDYSMNPRTTAEGTDFWKTLSASMRRACDVTAPTSLIETGAALGFPRLEPPAPSQIGPQPNEVFGSPQG